MHADPCASLAAQRAVLTGRYGLGLHMYIAAIFMIQTLACQVCASIGVLHYELFVASRSRVHDTHRRNSHRHRSASKQRFSTAITLQAVALPLSIRPFNRPCLGDLIQAVTLEHGKRSSYRSSSICQHTYVSPQSFSLMLISQLDLDFDAPHGRLRCVPALPCLSGV